MLRGKCGKVKIIGNEVNKSELDSRRKLEQQVKFCRSKT
jgi:hypothetical protein